MATVTVEAKVVGSGQVYAIAVQLGSVGIRCANRC